ncbi:hypothetical protein CFP56_013379 [Quercus suber]|uniref:Uncharacterized protein n=1 Tax=Quercus suber TaxID=58331 RepID=A0AAW0KWM7_QUESU
MEMDINNVVFVLLPHCPSQCFLQNYLRFCYATMKGRVQKFCKLQLYNERQGAKGLESGNLACMYLIWLFNLKVAALQLRVNEKDPMVVAQILPVSTTPDPLFLPSFIHHIVAGFIPCPASFKTKGLGSGSWLF